MKKAVIVAAGLSSRLYPLTENLPKCLLKVGEMTILERNVSLLKNHGIEEIYIVTGYLTEKIKDVMKDECTYIYNPFYKYCNNMGSLYFAKPFLKANESFLYMHGDIVFTEKLLTEFLKKASNETSDISLAVDFKEADEEAMKVKVTNDNYFVESNKELDAENSAGEWIGLAIIKNPHSLFQTIQEVLMDEKLNVYDTYAFTEMVKKGSSIKCFETYKEKWIEIDFIEDYEAAKRMF